MRRSVLASMCCTALLILPACKPAPAPAQGDAGGGAPGNRPAPPASRELTVAYGIDLEVEGAPSRRVAEDFRFRSGDGVRLVIRPDFAAHVWVFNRGVGESTYSVLATPSAGHDSRPPHKAGDEILIPAGVGDWLRFDKRAGSEDMVVVMAPADVPQLHFDATAVPREQFDAVLAEIDRDWKPTRFRRAVSGDWVRLSAAGTEGRTAIVVRLPLHHQ